jgi:very-short-patch-repair endonuclease
MESLTAPASVVWGLVHSQHGVITHEQLLEFGFTPRATNHRIRTGRLRPIHRGVYAVGRPDLTRKGEWMAAVLACGRGAVLSHASAAALWGIWTDRGEEIEVTVNRPRAPRRPGIRVHRRSTPFTAAVHDGIAVTPIVETIVDIAPRCRGRQLERAVNEADALELIDPDALRAAIEHMQGTPGVPSLRKLLDPLTFVLTDSDVERLFLPIARSAGLPKPLTRIYVNGYKVDFYWPELGLVVEADSLRYHRTAAQQARDRLRDQAHMAKGLIPLRFTHWQIAHERRYVRKILLAVSARVTPGPAPRKTDGHQRTASAC